MRTMFKKAVSVLLATAVVVSGVAVANGSTAEAAKKKTKTYKARVYFAGTQKGKDCLWIAGDESPAKPVIKKVKITQGKKATVNLTVKNINKQKVTGAVVCTVDMMDLLKDYKENKVKISNVVVKADGKKVSVKPFQGCFEPRKKKGKFNYRLSLFNQWGTDGDNSKMNNAKKFAFKKKLTISFKIVAK